MSKLSDQLVKIHRQNYRRNEKLIRQMLGANHAVEKYEREYLRYVKDYQEVSHRSDLIKSCIQSNIVYHGDYHTLRQSQRSVVRMLRDIVGKRKIIVCLEMFYGADQIHVDQYLKKKINERTLLKRINYYEKWPFKWSNWRPILHFCKENQLPVIAINNRYENNGTSSLVKRDKYAAQLLAKALIRYPDHLVYVVHGDYHISPNHLPVRVEALLKPFDMEVNRTIVYQNADSLYWKLTREGKEDADVLKVSEDSYCVMNTMPANKLQSYLNWLDTSEDAYFPIHKEWDDTPYESQGLSIHRMIKTIASLLKMDLPENWVQRLQVYYSSDFGLMDNVSGIPELNGQMKKIKERISREEGFLLSYYEDLKWQFIIYLANSNINMTAHQAGRLMRALFAAPVAGKVNTFDKFYIKVMEEALAFLSSKLINEKRRSYTVHSIRTLMRQSKKGVISKTESNMVKVSDEILLHAKFERQRFEASLFKKEFKRFYRARSHESEIFPIHLGCMLGNKLYYALKKGKLPLQLIQNILTNSFAKKDEAFEVYKMLTLKLKELKSSV